MLEMSKLNVSALDFTSTISFQGTGYFPLVCCANHSCKPNAKATRRTGNDIGQDVCLMAVRNIRKGEEVFITYIDATMSLEDRTTALEDYGFTCTCELCEDERNDTGCTRSH